jgi:pimeloyl-ACP methyl ester carboxylesterase
VSATAHRSAGVVGPSSRLVLLLEKFRAKHSTQTLDVGGERWEYIAAGSGENTLVILPGAGGSAELMFEIVSALEPSHRVVSIGYPATASTAQRLIRGVLAILEENGIGHAFVVGHSLGGTLAQAFALQHPERVQGMVLADTGLYRGVRGLAMSLFVQAMAYAPASLLTRFTKSQMNRLTKNADAHEFWFEYFDEKFSEPEQPARQKHQVACFLDLVRFIRQQPIRRDLDWVQSMPVLLITSEDERGSMQAIYPKSTVYTFPRGVGHASFVVRPREFSDAIASFVEKVAVAYNGNA